MIAITWITTGLFSPFNISMKLQGEVIQINSAGLNPVVEGYEKLDGLK